VTRYERRLEAMEGKAMIVCMSRRICIEMYNAIVQLRPEWATGPNDDDLSARGDLPADRHGAQAGTGKLCVAKIVMTGSAEDGPDWQQHIRNKERRRKLAARFKDPKDPFKIVIVRDMWLTGFDAPVLSTMYIDKPMRGHSLMQAIARVNRVFRDKPGGLVVDYLGLADQLKQALAVYTESGGKGSPSLDTAKAIAVMQEKHEVACGMMHPFDWSKWKTGTPAQKMSLLPGAQEHILSKRMAKTDSSRSSLNFRKRSRCAPEPKKQSRFATTSVFFKRSKRPCQTTRPTQDDRRTRSCGQAISREGHRARR
jgi:type I restriction enzyme, R subunit